MFPPPHLTCSQSHSATTHLGKGRLLPPTPPLLGLQPRHLPIPATRRLAGGGQGAWPPGFSALGSSRPQTSTGSPQAVAARRLPIPATGHRRPRRQAAGTQASSPRAPASGRRADQRGTPGGSGGVVLNYLWTSKNHCSSSPYVAMLIVRYIVTLNCGFMVLLLC